MTQVLVKQNGLPIFHKSWVNAQRNQVEVGESDPEN